MKRHNRIYWEKGLEITPEIFIASENHSEQDQSVIRRLCTLKSYGILPKDFQNEIPFLIEARIEEDSVIISKLFCHAITQRGHLIEINNDIQFDKIELNECISGNYYIVVRVYPYQNEPMKYNRPYAQLRYDISIVNVEEILDEGVPILKIYYSEFNNWEIDKEYISPSIAICSDKNIIVKYQFFKKRLKDIISKIKDELLINQLTLLEFELSSYLLLESPFELVSLIKKILKCIEIYLNEKLPFNQDFINQSYNHLEISWTLNSALECLNEIEQLLEKGPEVEKEVEILPKI